MILYRPGLSFKDNRIYGIFNIMLLFAIVVIILISSFLLNIGSILPFWICIGEIVVFATLFIVHVKGYFFISRYIFFLFAISMQVYGSLYHGENGGFDFLFFTTALTPVLFFDKKGYYLSLFILSIGVFIMVKYLYAHVDPILPLERQVFPYYSNIFISALLIYFGYVLFKSEHLKHEFEINQQRDKIYDQNEALSTVKNQLEELLEARTKQIHEQNQDIVKYAYLNSHKVRSPLARILGLVNLTKYEDLKIEEKRRFYFKELKTNAIDLDKVLKEITQILNRTAEQ